jgi:hypothetical protein
MDQSQTPAPQPGQQMGEPKKSMTWLWIVLIVVIIAAAVMWFMLK